MRIQRIQRGRVNSSIDITEKEFESFLATDETLSALDPELLVRQILVKNPVSYTHLRAHETR